MSLVWIGALLLVAGVVYMAIQPLRRAPLSGGQIRPGKTRGTLEPRRPGSGFDIRSNLPGLALVAAGAVLLLAAGAF